MKELKENIIIFGASTRGIFVYEKLKHTFCIKYFCDNDSSKFNKTISGITIISPDQLKDLEYKVIIASMYHEEISNQLMSIGMSNFEIYPSAIECVISRLKAKGVKINDLDALEVFGGNGKGIEIYYADEVKKIEIWEINENFKTELQTNLPKADIKIVDSFEEVKRTSKTYDMIVMDNPMQKIGNHCEHFDMFIDIFRVIKDECILILDIIPNIESATSEFGFLKLPDQILCRKLFYRTATPLNIPIEEIVDTYKDIISRNNYMLEWYFIEERSKDFIKFLVLKIKKLT